MPIGIPPHKGIDISELSNPTVIRIIRKKDLLHIETPRALTQDIVRGNGSFRIPSFA
jgi:hypothetical protein